MCVCNTLPDLEAREYSCPQHMFCATETERSTQVHLLKAGHSQAVGKTHPCFPLADLPRVPSNLPIRVSASRLPLSLITTQKSFPCFQGLFFLVCSVYYRAVLTHGINDRVCNETTVMHTPSALLINSMLET